MNQAHRDAAHCSVVCLPLVFVLVCLRYSLILRSCCDLWFSSGMWISWIHYGAV